MGDQRTSSSVIMSLILKSKSLAEICNLMSKEVQDVAEILMEKSKWFLKLGVSKESVEILLKNRDCMKKLNMTRNYGSTYDGRRKTLENFINNKDDIHIISKEFPNFLNSAINGIEEKVSKFKEIIKFYLDKSKDGMIEIDTVDGSKLSWCIFSNINKDNKEEHIKRNMKKKKNFFSQKKKKKKKKKKK